MFAWKKNDVRNYDLYLSNIFLRNYTDNQPLKKVKKAVERKEANMHLRLAYQKKYNSDFVKNEFSLQSILSLVRIMVKRDLSESFFLTGILSVKQGNEKK